MIKRKNLGQHFLKSNQIAKFIVDSSNLKKSDVVYEIGIGQGILIPFLCENANYVISTEKDKILYEQAIQKFSNIKNLSIIHGDGFKQNEEFDIFISNLPYSQSKIAINWMLMQKFSLAIIMLLLYKRLDLQIKFLEELFRNSHISHHHSLRLLD